MTLIRTQRTHQYSGNPSTGPTLAWRKSCLTSRTHQMGLFWVVLPNKMVLKLAPSLCVDKHYPSQSAPSPLRSAQDSGPSLLPSGHKPAREKTLIPAPAKGFRQTVFHVQVLDAHRKRWDLHAGLRLWTAQGHPLEFSTGSRSPEFPSMEPQRQKHPGLERPGSTS